jgi:hypothetical protein
MRKEFADRNSERKIIPPTQAEFAEAARRGRILSSDLLREMRTEARATRKASVTPPVAKLTQVSPAPSDTLTVTKLKNKVERLKNEIAVLKVLLMTK